MFLNSESDYYFARERAARRLAANAADRAAKSAHLEMAEEYRRRAFACEKMGKGPSATAASARKVQPLS